MGIDNGFRRGIHITPGAGIVALLGDFVAFASGEDTGLNQLVVRLNALADAEWPEVVRTLTADIASSGFDSHPVIACAKVGDDRVGVLVFGATTIMVATDREIRVLDGSESNTWIDVAVHGSPTKIQCGSQSESGVVGLLRDGVVPGGGFTFDAAGPIPAATPWVDLETLTDRTNGSGNDPTALFGAAHPIPDSPAELMPDRVLERRDPGRRSRGMFGRVNDMRPAPPSQVDGFDIDESVIGAINDLVRGEVVAPVPEPPPTEAIEWPDEPPPTPVLATTVTRTLAIPQVHGILCPDGHFTSVRDRSCRTCGKRPDRAAELHIGERPILGMVTFDDGAVLSIDRPAAIGHDVAGGYEIDGEPAIVALIGDNRDTIAPVHVELRLVGWDIEVVSMSPDFATYTRLEGVRRARTKLRTRMPTLLTPGMMVELGSRSFVLSAGGEFSSVED